MEPITGPQRSQDPDRGVAGFESFLDVYRRGGRGIEGLVGTTLTLGADGSEYQIEGHASGSYAHRVLFVKRIADGEPLVLKVLEPVSPEFLKDSPTHSTAHPILNPNT